MWCLREFARRPAQGAAVSTRIVNQHDEPCERCGEWTVVTRCLKCAPGGQHCGGCEQRIYRCPAGLTDYECGSAGHGPHPCPGIAASPAPLVKKPVAWVESILVEDGRWKIIAVPTRTARERGAFTAGTGLYLASEDAEPPCSVCGNRCQSASLALAEGGGDGR